MILGISLYQVGERCLLCTFAVDDFGLGQMHDVHVLPVEAHAIGSAVVEAMQMDAPLASEGDGPVVHQKMLSLAGASSESVFYRQAAHVNVDFDRDVGYTVTASTRRGRGFSDTTDSPRFEFGTEVSATELGQGVLDGLAASRDLNRA